MNQVIRSFHHAQPTTQAVQLISPADFYRKLLAHDWYYAWSDEMTALSTVPGKSLMLSWCSWPTTLGQFRNGCSAKSPSIIRPVSRGAPHATPCRHHRPS